jgi:hypothetical protein
MRLSKKSFHYYIATRYGNHVDGYNTTVVNYILALVLGQLLVLVYGLGVWIQFFLVFDAFILDYYMLLHASSLPPILSQHYVAFSFGGCIVFVLVFNYIKDKICARIKQSPPAIVTFKEDV